MKCPITQNKCSKKLCSWYSESYENCSVKLIGESLTDISVLAENDGIVIQNGD